MQIISLLSLAVFSLRGLTPSLSSPPHRTESTVFFPEQTHSVEEDVGELFIPVHRSGDISQELMVVCYTQQGTDESLFHLI